MSPFSSSRFPRSKLDAQHASIRALCEFARKSLSHGGVARTSAVVLGPCQAHMRQWTRGQAHASMGAIIELSRGQRGILSPFTSIDRRTCCPSPARSRANSAAVIAVSFATAAGGVGKKGKSGLIGRASDLKTALEEKERLYFVEHRVGNTVAKANGVTFEGVVPAEPREKSKDNLSASSPGKFRQGHFPRATPLQPFPLAGRGRGQGEGGRQGRVAAPPTSPSRFAGPSLSP
jgi:hypothetical protein